MRGLREDLIDLFNHDLLTIQDAGPLSFEPTSAVLTRNKKLGLELTLTSKGWSRRDGPDIPAGTIYQSDDTISFSSPSGARYTARGVIYRSHAARSTVQGMQTTHVYSLHSIEMHAQLNEQSSYVLEWVGNLSTFFIGSSHVSFDDIENSTITIGQDDAIVIKRSATSSGTSKTLKLRAGSHDIYLVHFGSNNDESHPRDGYIAYKGIPNSDERQKLRDCIAFTLGLPIILCGYTEYGEQGLPLYMKSYSPYAYGGKAFDLGELPPYPINAPNTRNMIDETRLGRTVDALYNHYDALNFEALSWTYWHGVCTAISMSAVYFGGLIEQLQRASKNVIDTGGATLTKTEKWDQIKASLLDIIASSEIDPAAQTVMRNKIVNLNQLPPNMALERLQQLLGLAISEAEKSAWKHRNSAAHGTVRKDHDAVILNSKLLRLMFHRILAALTHCSDAYIDYYSLGFPTRALSDDIPAWQEFD